MHPNDASPTAAELATATAALGRLQGRPSDNQGFHGRAVVLLYVLCHPGAYAREMEANTTLTLQQVARAIVFLEKARLLSRRNDSAVSEKIRCCYATTAGAAYIRNTVLPYSEREGGQPRKKAKATATKRRTYRNVVHPTLLDRSTYLGYRRAMRRNSIAVPLDRFALSLVFFLGKESSLLATWYQSELYPITPTRRSKAKHRETDPDTISQRNVRGRFGNAVRHLGKLHLVTRWQDRESRKIAWMFKKLEALDDLYKRINQALIT